MYTPVTFDQAARHYDGTGLTRSAIRRGALRGDIPYVRVGTKYLVTLENIDLWLSGRSTPQPQPAQDASGIRQINE